MRKILKALKIIQEVKNKEKKLGRGYSTAIRLNPYNPLSYITIILVIVIGIIALGIYGFWKETDIRNPFKWN